LRVKDEFDLEVILEGEETLEKDGEVGRSMCENEGEEKN